MKKNIIIAILFLLASGILMAKDINLTHLTVKDGLLSATVYYAMQDSKGFIWFCTETGVNRYDGRTFERFTINNGLADNENFKCFEDSENRIWFLSYNGKLSYFYKGNFYNDRNTPWLAYKYSGSFLLDMIEDKNKCIWISTSSGDVLQLRNNIVNIIPTPFYQRQYNYCYVGAPLFVDHDSVKKFVEAGGAPTGEIYDFNLTTRKIIYLGRHQEIINPARPCNFDSMTSGKATHFFIVENTLIAYDLKGRFHILNKEKMGISSRLLSFLPVENDWWLGTAGDGAYLVKSGTLPGEKELHVLPEMNVTCILKDREENIWFTTHGYGVFILKNNARFITSIKSGMTYSVGVIRSKGDKYIIAGGGNGNLSLIRDDTVYRSLQLSDKKFNRVKGIFTLSDTQILITTDAFLACGYNLVTNVVTQFGEKQGYKNGSLSPGGYFWACTPDEVFKLEGGSFNLKLNAEKIGKLTAICAISDSTLYVSTTDLLYKVNVTNGAHRVILDRATLKTGVTDIKAANGALWVATRGNGIFILKDDTICKRINTRDDGIVSDFCQKLYDDKQNYVWVACDQGISVLNRYMDTLLCNLSSSTGLASDDVKNITSYGDEIYAATAEGTDVFKLNDIFAYSQPPNVYVTGFKRGNESITDPDSAVRFDYFKGPVNIYFTAITFQAPGDVQFEYKLGSTAEWQRSRTTNISLFALTPGTHKLLLRAKKYNSAWSKPVVLSIIVNPLWYQTSGFYILLGICFLSLVYYIMQRRIKDVHTRSAEQNMLHQKITELENKSLAYQMNPHFIFNSLNTVQQFMLVKEPQLGISYLNDFAMLMRKMLENSRHATIPLSEEIDFLKCYLHLEKIRFNDKFEYQISVDDQLLEDDIAIPPILFQPLLENAIKHGIAPSGKGAVKLTIIKENDFLAGIVEDNGIGINAAHADREDMEDKRESTALKVLEERLKLIKNRNGQSGYMSIRDKNEINGTHHGTVVEIRIPING